MLVLLFAFGCSFRHGSLGAGDADTGDTSTPDALGPAWPYKRKLTLANNGLAALDNFPLLVVLDATRIRYTPAGADVRFTDIGGVQLPYEIESWNASGSSYVWVKVPHIDAATTTDLWMYYGNAGATDGQTPTAVWDASYVGVWHLVDAHDSTGKNASTNSAATATTGRIGPALAFASGAYVDTMSTSHLDRWTIEAWMKPTFASGVATAGSSIISRFPNYLMLWDCNSSAFCHSVLYDGSASTSAGSYRASYTASAGAWTQVAGSYDGTAVRAYVAGVMSGQQSTTDTPLDVTASAKIGIRQDLMGPFTGAIDEVRISSVARSTDYLLASVRAATDTYITFGAEQ